MTQRMRARIESDCRGGRGEFLGEPVWVPRLPLECREHEPVGYPLP